MSALLPPEARMQSATPQDPPVRDGPVQHSDPSEVVVSARSLRCRYGTFEAVRGIDLSVVRGELFALLGTNGAGKTTTLETLEGHRQPDAGQVEVLGLDPSEHSSKLAARVGVMFQHSGQPADLTPTEMLTLWTQLTPSASPHLGTDEVLARVDLGHRAGVRIRQLSGGERRRLDLAIAVLTRPEVLFLDEPTTGMDPEARVRTWGTIRDLLSDGATIVLTTHYLEEAQALADRLAIMHRGRLAVIGTLSDVVSTQPATIQALLPQETNEIPDFEGESKVDPDRRLTISTAHLQRDLTRLLTWADRHQVRLQGLRAAEASLERVFHEIAGARPLGEPNSDGGSPR